MVLRSWTVTPSALRVSRGSPKGAVISTVTGSRTSFCRTRPQKGSWSGSCWAAAWPRRVSHTSLPPFTTSWSTADTERRTCSLSGALPLAFGLPPGSRAPQAQRQFAGREHQRGFGKKPGCGQRINTAEAQEERQRADAVDQHALLDSAGEHE